MSIHLPPGHRLSQINPPVSGVNFSNNIPIPQVWVKKLEHDTTFEISELLKPFLGEKHS